MEKLTIILHDPPYCTEKVYKGLGYASALVSTGVQLNRFLLADGVGQLAVDRRHRPAITTWPTCMAMGLGQQDLIASVALSPMLDLKRWTKESDSVLMFCDPTIRF